MLENAGRSLGGLQKKAATFIMEKRVVASATTLSFLQKMPPF